MFAAPDVRPRDKGGRGTIKARELIAMLEKGKIDIDFDRSSRTWKAVGPNYSHWDTAVGIHTRYVCVPFLNTWEDVDQLAKLAIQ